jgi:hypothetical protein
VKTLGFHYLNFNKAFKNVLLRDVQEMFLAHYYSSQDFLLRKTISYVVADFIIFEQKNVPDVFLQFPKNKKYFVDLS